MHERIIVIGTSAGGLEALRMLVGALPADFDTPIAIVMHVASESPGVLHEILNRTGPVTAGVALSGERLRPGRLYVAPPDRHLLVEPGRLRLTRGPKENRFRPAIDPLFRTAAQVYGPAAIGVILTGNLDDGTAGLWAIKKLGGTTIVQEPGDAMFPAMPESAARHVEVDHRVPLADIAPLLVRLTAAPV
jgi:two-component system chemotaxis response regulator CheB